MTCAAYGFIEFKELLDSDADLLRVLQNASGLGLRQIAASELYNFPDSVTPTGRAVCFCLTDSPSSLGVEYLLDNLDYADEAEIGMPLQSKDRLALIDSLVRSIFDNWPVTRFALALTYHCYIEETKEVLRQDILATLIQDFSAFAPPNCIYVVTA